MNNSRSCRLRLACGALALIFFSAAHAQMGGMPGMHMDRGGPPRGSEGNRGTSTPSPSPSEAVSDQLLQARMRLLVGREQAAAWERFQGAFLAVRMNGARQAGTDAPASAAQAMELQLGAAQNRYARMEELAEALKALLALLDERQRKTADEVLPRLLLESLEGNRPPAGARLSRGD